jgi:hypothetical protein
MAGASGPVYSCDEWEKVQKGPFSISNPIVEPTSYPYRKLTDCFFPNKQLEPFNSDTVGPVAQRYARETIGSDSDSQIFTKLAQPTEHKKGAIRDNPLYMRPDRVYADLNKGVFPTKKDTSDITPQIFTQNLFCERAEENGKSVDYAHASLEVQKKMFSHAIEETRDAQQAIYQSQFSYCGRECSQLVNDGISRNAQENFADWLAIRTFPSYLKRARTEQERRDIAALSFVLMCDAPGPGRDAPWLTELEKKFSLEPHPDNRRRRLSVFTPDVAAVVGCKRDSDVQKGDSGCSL